MPKTCLRRLSKYTWCLTSTETITLIRDGEKGGGGMGGGGGGGDAKQALDSFILTSSLRPNRFVSRHWHRAVVERKVIPTLKTLCPSREFPVELFPCPVLPSNTTRQIPSGKSNTEEHVTKHPVNDPCSDKS